MTKRQTRRTAGRGLNKNKLFGAVLVVLIVLGVLVVYYVFFFQDKENWTAAIIDQVAIEGLFNPEFNDTITILLAASGFDVKYYPGEDVTVDFYKTLPSKGGRVILIRAHSAVREDNVSVDLFTSEPFMEGKYYEYGKQISRAQFLISNNEYFAIGPTFVQNSLNPSMKGIFADSLIVLMGCNSLSKTTMAEALVSRGAKVVLGWMDLVELSDTDASTIELFQYLLAETPYTVQGAVNKINESPHFVGATMDYYPKDAGNYIVPKRGGEAPLDLMKGSVQISLLTTSSKWKWIVRARARLI